MTIEEKVDQLLQILNTPNICCAKICLNANVKLQAGRNVCITVARLVELLCLMGILSATDVLILTRRKRND